MVQVDGLGVWVDYGTFGVPVSRLTRSKRMSGRRATLHSLARALFLAEMLGRVVMVLQRRCLVWCLRAKIAHQSKSLTVL